MKLLCLALATSHSVVLPVFYFCLLVNLSLLVLSVAMGYLKPQQLKLCDFFCKCGARADCNSHSKNSLGDDLQRHAIRNFDSLDLNLHLYKTYYLHCSCMKEQSTSWLQLIEKVMAFLKTWRYFRNVNCNPIFFFLLVKCSVKTQRGCMINR